MQPVEPTALLEHTLWEGCSWLSGIPDHFEHHALVPAVANHNATTDAVLRYFAHREDCLTRVAKTLQSYDVTFPTQGFIGSVEDLTRLTTRPSA